VGQWPHFLPLSGKRSGADMVGELRQGSNMPETEVPEPQSLMLGGIPPSLNSQSPLATGVHFWAQAPRSLEYPPAAISRFHCTGYGNFL
jgi:hypothetical protein